MLDLLKAIFDLLVSKMLPYRWLKALAFAGNKAQVPLPLFSSCSPSQLRGAALVTAFQSEETSTGTNKYLYWSVHIRWERWVAAAGRGADLKFWWHDWLIGRIWLVRLSWRSKRPQSADWEVGERERELWMNDDDSVSGWTRAELVV